MFKFCGCDCGHGSLKKDCDYVPPQPPAPVNNNQEAGAAGGAPAPVPAPDKKKKKKEKVNLKPKLVYNRRDESGTALGSIKQKEEEEEEKATRTMRRLSSSEKSDSSSSSPFIPGLNTPAASKPASPALSRSSSISKTAGKGSVSENLAEEGWVKVSSSRRGSQSQQDLSQYKQSSEVFPSLPLASKPPLTQTSKTQTSPAAKPPALSVSKPIAKVKASPPLMKSVSKPSPLAAPQVPRLPELAPQEPTSPIEVKQLPMFQPLGPKRFYDTSSPSSLRYETGTQPPIGSQQGRRTSSTSPGHNLGARPKYSPILSDEVYLSDEEVTFGDWIDPTAIDKDKDMDDLFNQTRQFDRNMSLVTPDKMDINGFFNCHLCNMVFRTEEEYEAHLKSEKHLNAERLQSDLMSVSSLKGGWESISVRPDIWQPPDTFVTPEEFKEFKLKMKEFKQQLAKETKEKEELTVTHAGLKKQYDEEVKAKQEAVNCLNTFKAEALRLARDEKEKFEAEIIKSKGDVLSLKEVVDSLTVELKEMREEEEKSSKKSQHSKTNHHSMLEKEMKIEIINLKRDKCHMETQYKDLSASYRESQKKIQDLKTIHEVTKEQLSETMKKALGKENVDNLLEQQTNENKKTADRLKDEVRKKIIAELEVKKLREELEAKKEIEKSFVKEIEVLKTGLDKINTIKGKLEQEVASHVENLADIEDLKQKPKAEVMERLSDSRLSGQEDTLVDGYLESALSTSEQEIEEPKPEEKLSENTHENASEERNSVFDLFDEVNSQRKKKAAGDISNIWNLEDQKPDSVGKVNIRTDLSNIISVSIKDEALRNCLSSIIDQGGDEENKDSTQDRDQEEDGPDPYDTLDRFVQPGLDDEIEPYLGEDKPGEFEEFLSVNEDADDQELQETAEPKNEVTEMVLNEIIQTISDSEDDVSEQKQTITESSSDTNPKENEDDGILNISTDDEDRHLEQEKPKPIVNSAGDLDVKVVSNDVIELDLRPNEEELPESELDDMEDVHMLRVSMPCISDRLIMRAEDDMGKKMEDMNAEELTEHMRLLAEMTRDDVFVDPLLQRIPWLKNETPEDEASVDTIPLPLENPPEAGDTCGVDMCSRKTSLSSLSSSNSTQHDASSLTSDSPLPESSSLGQDEPRVISLERTVASLQSMVLGLADQVATLTNKMDDSNFEAGLLNKTVEMLQKKNTKLTESVEVLEAKNEVMEKKLKEAEKSSPNNEVNGLRESFLEILASCETFQNSFDSMSEKQIGLDDKLKMLTDNFDQASSENKTLRKEFDGLAKEVSSLKLEFQVDKGQTKRLMDDMAYNLAVVTNKSSSSSSTSGVKSDEVSDPDDLDKVGSLAFLGLPENPTETKAGGSKTETIPVKDLKTNSVKKIKIKTKAAPVTPTIPQFATLPTDPGAALLHYGGVLPPGVQPPVQSPQQGAMARPPTMMTTRMPIAYPHFGNQIFSHGNGAVSYPAFYYAPR